MPSTVTICNVQASPEQEDAAHDITPGGLMNAHQSRRPAPVLEVRKVRQRAGCSLTSAISAVNLRSSIRPFSRYA